MCILTKAMRDDFIAGVATKNPYVRKFPGLSICNKIDISFAAANLYAYGTPFWTRGGQIHLGKIGLGRIVVILDPLVEKVWVYFNKKTYKAVNQSNFDAFHESLCDLFLSSFASAGYTHTYGNAQKFVNMLYKYLACYKDASRYADWFKYCHMALDGYTYHGGYKLPYYQKVVCGSACGKSLTAWSKLNKEEREEGKKGYLEIVSDIRAYIPAKAKVKTYNDYLELGHSIGLFATIPPLAEDYVLTPFEAEFFIWAICKACEKLPPAEIERVRAAF